MKKLIILSFLILYTLGLSAQTDSVVLSPNELWVKTIQQRLDSITDGVKKQRYSAGYCIMDLTDDSVIYRYNEKKMLKPASTQKLFVATTALRYLGKDYKFRTCLDIDGNIATDDKGRRYLKGDICIRGSYDPTIKVEDIELFREKIMSLHIDSIDGMIIADSRVRLDLRKIKDMPKYVAEELYKSLRNNNMAFSSPSPFASSEVPLTRGWNLAVIYTPIDKVMKRMLKQSDNTYAECMLQNLCEISRTADWSYERCKGNVIKLVEEVAGNAEGYIIDDGSGLSYSNKCTSEMLINLLRYDYHMPDIYNSIYENLPIAGVDGTLSKRMKGTPLINNVRAKTGTLNDTSTLAGYVTSNNGHILAFAIMTNGLRGLSSGKLLQDNICRIITQ